MEFRAFATKLIAPACLIRHLPLAIVVVSASLSGPTLAVDINQHGLTGSWYNPAAAGQGVEIEVYQDAIASGVGYLQGSWATFSVGWETGQRRKQDSAPIGFPTRVPGSAPRPAARGPSDLRSRHARDPGTR